MIFWTVNNRDTETFTVKRIVDFDLKISNTLRAICKNPLYSREWNTYFNDSKWHDQDTTRAISEISTLCVF